MLFIETCLHTIFSFSGSGLLPSKFSQDEFSLICFGACNEYNKLNYCMKITKLLQYVYDHTGAKKAM